MGSRSKQRLGRLMSSGRESMSRNLSRGALQSRASSVFMGFRRASKTAVSLNAKFNLQLKLEKRSNTWC